MTLHVPCSEVQGNVHVILLPINSEVMRILKATASKLFTLPKRDFYGFCGHCIFTEIIRATEYDNTQY